MPPYKCESIHVFVGYSEQCLPENDSLRIFARKWIVRMWVINKELCKQYLYSRYLDSFASRTKMALSECWAWLSQKVECTKLFFQVSSFFINLLAELKKTWEEFLVLQWWSQMAMPILKRPWQKLGRHYEKMCVLILFPSYRPYKMLNIRQTVSTVQSKEIKTKTMKKP